jgi:3-deoxy-manno-octulosonate cytidylyltransferase (CMP-KDO synthetase)
VTSHSFRVVIPARFESSRLPGKVLLAIGGKPMVQHVWERAMESGAGDVIIATDDERVASVAQEFGARVCRTSAACNSGTDRVAEVCREMGWQDDVPIVNVQGDAPLLPPASIARVADLLIENPAADIATLCVAIKSLEDYLDPNVVKVVFDRDGKALYFSRSPIPASSHGLDPEKVWRQAFRHLGLYGYRPGALQTLSAAPPCELEQAERLEQLRAMWLGMQIVITVDEQAHGPDVDTAEDLQAVEQLINANLKSDA